MFKIKKSLIYFFIFITIIIIIPALCTRRKKVTDIKIAENKEVPKYDYTKYGKVKLLHKSDNSIEEIPIDEYICGVVSAEMPANYEIEALKAQAISARTYTIYKIENSKNKHGEADICDDSTCCQAWISKQDRFQKWEEAERENNWNKITSAVNTTAGKIITYKNEPINAFFHSNSGGITESASNVWGEKDIPYLKSVETVGEEGYAQYSSEVILTKQELIERLKIEYPDIQINYDEEECIKILEYTTSKRVKTIKFGNIEVSGTNARSILGLKSTNFEIKIDGDKIIFSVIGYGHGVGLSKTGANSMAKQGKNCEEIIKHFYTGVEITQL